MDSVMIKDFQNRIVNATKKELLLINYELLFIAIDEAAAAVEEKERGHFDKGLSKAKRLLRELTDGLDFRFDISNELMALYVYVNGQLIKAGIKYDKEPLLVSKNILKNLYSGFQGIEEVGASPIIENGEKVYAGLTYGKGQLNETVYEDTSSRGFRV